MRRKRFTEEHIIQTLKEHEAGATPDELKRRHGVSSSSLYAWKRKYGGLEVSDAKRLKALEDENRRLKKLVADQALDLVMLKELNERRLRRLYRIQGLTVRRRKKRRLVAQERVPTSRGKASRARSTRRCPRSGSLAFSIAWRSSAAQDWRRSSIIPPRRRGSEHPSSQSSGVRADKRLRLIRPPVRHRQKRASSRRSCGSSR